jgi:glycerol-3-phosphate acyltransferase PlsY
MEIKLFISIILSYFIGSIPTGLWLTKLLKGIDIRTVGSGSTGGTNVTRALGAKWGVFVIIFDAVKGAVSVLLATQLLSSQNNILLIISASVFSVIGHIWTIFANFKGGKGIATSLGFLLALRPTETSLALSVFILVFLISRIVSISSLSAALSLLFIYPIKFYFFYAYSYYDFIIYFILMFLLNIIVFYTHRENIKRLLKGEEKKLVFKK